MYQKISDNQTKIKTNFQLHINLGNLLSFTYKIDSQQKIMDEFKLPKAPSFVDYYVKHNSSSVLTEQ